MKLAAIMLATALALSSTAALAQTAAQTAGTAGYGSVVAPSVGSYYWPSVGSTNAVPTWSNTTNAAPLPGRLQSGSATVGASAVRR
ncbi:hypothetical protein AAFX91_35475 [Bradyrhizobium sp. 31Argb]|uniref:hypothetical protein n=1 Tax=unclassified Bradyrhizobium TaxID=2631580 RepID=UPI00249DF3FB|nr:hypothetical protein [Bradyrhizobium sp. Arg237L]MDI4235089.1 hypothetical protein [Bradyrhizobium sp. Arg237L]